MRVEGVQCDTCTKFQNKTEDSPYGWFTLIAHRSGMGDSEFHFCCPGHLRDWLEKKLQEVES